MQDNYDVIIIGAGIAGLECAKNLAGSNLSVLAVERDKWIGRKTCAEGIMLHDLEYIPDSFMNFDFQKMIIHYRNKKVIFPKKGGVFTTISRKSFLSHRVKSLRKLNNIEIITGVSVSEIISNKSLKLNNGRKLEFDFLVGADGSSSITRKYLNLPSKKLEIAIQYIIPRKFKNFEFYLNDKLFGTGAAWIHPNKDYASIGCGSDLRFMNPQKLKDNFNIWLKENNFDISGARFEASLINYDYKGYRFGNIFLAGDAAGLASGLSGQGIYSASLSGKQIATDIVEMNKSPNLIEKWLKEKKKQERYIFFLKKPFLRKIFFLALIISLPHRKIQEKVMKRIR